MRELLERIEREIERLRSKKESLTPEEKAILLELIRQSVCLRALLHAREALD